MRLNGSSAGTFAVKNRVGAQIVCVCVCVNPTLPAI